MTSERAVRFSKRSASDPNVSYNHAVQFFTDDDILVKTLARFVSAGLTIGESVVVIATSDHLRFVGNALVGSGFDLATAMIQDRYITLDAEKILSALMTGDRLDEKLFHELIGSMLRRASARKHRVRAYGELVALLWKQGNSAALLRLEELWNGFCRTHSLALFCGYPKNGFTRHDQSTVDAIHAVHSSVIAS